MANTIFVIDGIGEMTIDEMMEDLSRYMPDEEEETEAEGSGLPTSGREALLMELNNLLDYGDEILSLYGDCMYNDECTKFVKGLNEITSALIDVWSNTRS